MLDSRNKTHGFWGTAARTLPVGGVPVSEMWHSMFVVVRRWLGECPGVDAAELTRAYLDGKPGRHLADWCNSRAWDVHIAEVEAYLCEDRSSFLAISHELAPVAYVEE